MSNTGSQCVVCGAEAPPNHSYCSQCAGALGIEDPTQDATMMSAGGSFAQAPQQGGSSAGVASPEQPRQSTRASRLKHRYVDGYRVARFLNTAGALLKVLAFIIAVITVLGALVLAGEAVSQDRGPIFFGGFLFAVIWWAVFWVSGVVVSALGQITKAQIDSAVNTSPFATNDEKADIMSL